MIKDFIEKYMEKKEELRCVFSDKHPNNYKEIVTNIIKIIASMPEVNYPNPDPDRIHEIDDGEFQGTLLYIIAEDCYQPSRYWYVTIDYGSCSGCDILEEIEAMSFSSKPTTEQVEQYMILALHIVQGLKKLI